MGTGVTFSGTVLGVVVKELFSHYPQLSRGRDAGSMFADGDGFELTG